MCIADRNIVTSMLTSYIYSAYCNFTPYRLYAQFGSDKCQHEQLTTSNIKSHQMP